MAAKIQHTYTIDETMLEALKAHAAITTESVSGVIQRFIREGLERANAWPPKEKK